MIIYSVTVKIDNGVHDEWLHWMKTIHIPDVMATKLFIEHRIAKIMVDDDDGINYSIQYTCNNMDTLEQYQRDHAPRLQAEHTKRYKDKFVAFRTLLEVV